MNQDLLKPRTIGTLAATGFLLGLVTLPLSGVLWFAAPILVRLSHGDPGDVMRAWSYIGPCFGLVNHLVQVAALVTAILALVGIAKSPARPGGAGLAWAGIVITAAGMVAPMALCMMFRALGVF
jgi:hypothetical protein